MAEDDSVLAHDPISDDDPGFCEGILPDRSLLVVGELVDELIEKGRYLLFLELKEVFGLLLHDLVTELLDDLSLDGGP